MESMLPYENIYEYACRELRHLAYNDTEHYHSTTYHTLRDAYIYGATHLYNIINNNNAISLHNAYSIAKNELDKMAYTQYTDISSAMRHLIAKTYLTGCSILMKHIIYFEEEHQFM